MLSKIIFILAAILASVTAFSPGPALVASDLTLARLPV